MLTIVTAATESDLLAVARVKTELSISGSTEDTKLETLIAEASSLVAGYCNRDTFGEEELLQTERLRCAAECIVLARDLEATIDTVTVDGVALDAANFELDGSLLYRLENDVRIAWPTGKVEIGYTAGYNLPSAAPLPLARAALDLVVGMYRGAGRDVAVRSEQVDGVGQMAYFDTRSGPVAIPADRLVALGRYHLVAIA